MGIERTPVESLYSKWNAHNHKINLQDLKQLTSEHAPNNFDQVQQNTYKGFWFEKMKSVN